MFIVHTPQLLIFLYFFHQMLYMGLDWPQGYTVFRDRAKRAFAKGSGETDPQKIRELIQRGQFVLKEIEALYMLKKYRTLKKRYY